MPDGRASVVAAIVVLALLFDFTNGFHDAANSIATVVSTRVLTPRVAVVWAAFFNFVAFMVFKTHVANTVGKTVDPSVVGEAVVFAGLVGAIAWNLTTWWLGLPTSSSHALIGGFAGAGVAKAGFGVLAADSIRKTILFIVLSPLFGLVLAFLLMVAATWLFHRSTPRRVDGIFRRLQLVSAAAFSLGHGVGSPVGLHGRHATAALAARSVRPWATPPPGRGRRPRWRPATTAPPARRATTTATTTGVGAVTTR